MKQLIEFVAKSLVDHPDQVVVRETRRGGHIQLQLMVAEGDMGRVIGREGRVANALRRLIRVIAARHGQRVTLDID